MPAYYYTITTEDVASWKRTFLEWRNNTHQHGYDAYIEDCNNEISAWTNLKNIALNMDFLKGKYEGGKDPTLDDHGSPIDEDYVSDHPEEYDDTFTMVIDCERVAANSTITNPNLTLSPFQRQIFTSNAVSVLWNILNANKSPICDMKVYMDNSAGIFHGLPLEDELMFVDEDLRGGIDSNGIFYLLGKNFSIYANPYIFPVNITPSMLQLNMAFTDNNISFFITPSYSEYSAATCDLIDRTDPANPVYYTRDNPVTKNIVLTLKGRKQIAATEFGGYIEPAEWDDNMILSSYGNFKATQGSWCQRMFIDVIFQSGGFEYFAGAFYDHPLITGIDTGIVIVKSNIQKLEDIAYVNNYVISKFSYKADEEFKDHWNFLGQTATRGDCEDMTLTKLQMLLDLGWTINDLQLMYGCDTPRSETGDRQGHMWLEATVGASRYALDAIGVVSPAAMAALYPYDRMSHCKLEWTQLTDPYEIKTATPILHDEYNVTIGTAVCEVSKY